jgi:hypothetical protein
MGGGTVDLNPFTSSRFGGIVDWFRAAVEWSTLALFALWASVQVKEWVKATSVVKQAQGNAVLFGSGAQATAVTAAGVITVLIVVFLVALLGWLGGQFAIPALIGVLDDSPFGGLLSGAAWMVNRCFPVGIIIAAFVTKAAWNFFAASIFAVCSTAVRFIVP